MTPVPRLLATVSAIAAVCATAAADAPSGGEPRFRKVFAFTDIGDDEHAAKLAEMNVFAANCCDAGNRPDPEKIERAKRFGIVPYVAFGPFCGSHVQALSPEEARLQAELQGRFVPSDAKGDAGDPGRTDLWRTRHYRLGGEPEPGNAEVRREHRLLRRDERLRERGRRARGTAQGESGGEGGVPRLHRLRQLPRLPPSRLPAPAGAGRGSRSAWPGRWRRPPFSRRRRTRRSCRSSGRTTAGAARRS